MNLIYKAKFFFVFLMLFVLNIGYAQNPNRPKPVGPLTLTQDQINTFEQVPFFIVQYDGNSSTMAALEQSLQGVGTIRHRYQTIPYVAISIDAANFAPNQLENIPGIVAISKDGYSTQSLRESHAQTQALLAQQKGGTGAGCGIAIIDSGIDDRHCMFNGKLTHGSACFSTDFVSPGFFESISTCPRGATSLTDNTLANTYEVVQFFPDHGSNVAGIAAGAPCDVFNLSTFTPDNTPGGVASGAHIIPVNVFSEFSGFFNGALAYTSDQIAGLDWLLANKDALELCVVNMSLGGGGPEATPCADGAREAVIDALTAAGIAVVIATGNDGFDDGVSFPACIESAIAVGAVDDTGARAGFSNHLDAMVDLMAPGVNVNSAITDFTVLNRPTFNFTADFTGTSMATPTVAGAFAILKARFPQESVAGILQVLQQTGATVPGFTTKSIRIKNACDALDSKYLIPTMSEWGLMLFGLLVLNISVFALRRKEDILA